MATSNRNYSNLGADAKVRFMDLAPLPQERKDLLDAIEKVLLHGVLINGKEIGEFEREFAKIHNRKFARGCASGTAAVYYAIRAALDTCEESLIMPRDVGFRFYQSSNYIESNYSKFNNKAQATEREREREHRAA